MKSPIFKAILISASVGLVFIGGFLQWRSSLSSPEVEGMIADRESLEKGRLPALKGRGIEGTSFDVLTEKKKVVIVHFWASWCAPCVEELPTLVRFANEFKDDVQVYAISTDVSRKDLDIFLDGLKVRSSGNFLIIQDESGELAKNFGVDRLPESFVLNEKRQMEKKISGAVDWHTNESIQFFKKMLSK